MTTIAIRLAVIESVSGLGSNHGRAIRSPTCFAPLNPVPLGDDTE